MLTVDMFTPTERKIMAVLQDGLPHSVKQCLDGMDDPMYTYEAYLTHLDRVKKKIRPHGHDILFVKSNGRMCYQLVRKVASSVLQDAES